MEKIPVCDTCGNICKKGEEIGMIGEDGYFIGEVVSDCCDWGITYYDSIKEVILNRLE